MKLEEITIQEAQEQSFYAYTFSFKDNTDIDIIDKESANAADYESFAAFCQEQLKEIRPDHNNKIIHNTNELEFSFEYSHEMGHDPDPYPIVSANGILCSPVELDVSSLDVVLKKIEEEHFEYYRNDYLSDMED